MTFGGALINNSRFKRTLAVRRWGAGSFVNGVYEDPTPTVLSVVCVKVPMRGEFRVQEHNGARADESATFYSSTLLRTSRSESQQRADEIVDEDGREWLVERVDDYMSIGGYCEVRALAIVREASSSVVYFGTSVEVALTTSSMIKALVGQTSTARHLPTFRVDAQATEFVWYCAPASFVDPVFTVNGFDGGFVEQSAVVVDSVSYQVWRSVRANLGPLTVTVRDVD